MRKDTKLTTPNNKNFIKVMKDYNGVPYYSFLYNKSEKNKETQEWEIKERYVINVMNIELEENMDIIITEILEAKPQVMKSKNGKDYLNCLIWCNADKIKKETENTYYSNNNGGYNVSNNNNDNFLVNDDNEEELPF